MTKREIIIETKEFYTADPSRRGIKRTVNIGDGETNGVCHYQVPGTDKKCAVGRCLTPEGLKYALVTGAPIGLLWTEFNADRQVFFEVRYRGHDASFWTDLQRFHDKGIHWNKKGLTEEGTKYYNEILEKHKD